MNNIRSNNYSDITNRPDSSKLEELHVYIVPPDIYRRRFNNVLNASLDEMISVGFIRVPFETRLPVLREEIETQIGIENIPQNYVFLKNIGRSLTRVKQKQEGQLKVKNFCPPLAYVPEIYLYEITNETRNLLNSGSDSSSVHSLSRQSGSLSNDSPRVFPEHPRLPPISNSLDDSESDHLLQNNNLRMNENIPAVDSKSAETKRKLYHRQNSLTRSNHDNPDESDDLPSPRRFTKQSHSHISTESPVRSPMTNENHNVYDNDTNINHPIQEPEFMSQSQEDLLNDHRQEDENLENVTRTQTANIRNRTMSLESDHNLDSRSPDIEPKTDNGAEVNYEEMDNYAYNEFHKGDNHVANALDSNSADLNEFVSPQTEKGINEHEEFNPTGNFANYDDDDDDDDDDKERNSSRFSPESLSQPLSVTVNKNDDISNVIDDATPFEQDFDRFSPHFDDSEIINEEDKTLLKLEKDGLVRELNNAREDRRKVEKRREELVKRAKAMQTKTQNRRNHTRDLWKKCYFDEKKKTSPLEDQTNKLQSELEQIHRKLMGVLEPSADQRLRLKTEEPSQQSNMKIQVSKLRHENLELVKRIEASKLKLTEEIKIRNQTESRAKSLRSELTQKKINLTLTRSQQMPSLSTSQDNLIQSHALQYSP